MPERATVTCFCGQTGLTFANPLPRNHSECLCVDCRQKLEWACGEAGRPWTPTISNLWYIDDDVVATKGEEHLQEFVLRSSGEETPVVPGTQTEVVSPFVVATCCHSVLCVPAIYYNSNYVAVIEQGCRLQCQPCTPKIRYAVDEWQEAEWGALPRYEGDGLVLSKHVFQYRRPLDAGGTGTPEEREVSTAAVAPAISQRGR